MAEDRLGALLLANRNSLTEQAGPIYAGRALSL
jgi:hypothetical protein